MDVQTQKKLVVELYAAGKLNEAYQAIAPLVGAMPGDLTILDIFHKLRMEFNAARQLEILSDIGKQLKWINASTAQSLVDSLQRSPRFDDPLRLERYGHSVASQNEEDGILAEVFRRIGETNRTFFEFGVGNGLQNITMASLLAGWSGHWIEIHPGKAQFIRDRFSDAIRCGRLTLGTEPVTAENINDIAARLGVPQDIDLLSIDIDGNDYHVFKALSRVRARVVVMEYNPLYPPPLKVVMAYNPNYAFDETTYVGTSLESLCELAEQKGYRLVGCSIAGINAIFVRADLAEGKFALPATAANFYHPGRYQLSFSGGFGFGPRSTIGKFQVPSFAR